VTENFFLSDLIATSAAFCLFALFLFVPGYVFGWLLDIFGFRRRSLRARLAMSTPLSIGICPILTYLLWRWSLPAVWTMYAGCWIAFLALLVHDRCLWLSRPRISKTVGILLAIVAGWVVVGMLCLVDMQIGDRLYFPSIAYDYMLRTAVTASITHTGVPPYNPYFFPGHPALLRYHYFWYLPCSLVDQLGGTLVSPRHAMLASALWSGLGLMSLVTLYLRFFQPKASLNLDRRILLGIAMLGITGLDILPVAVIALLGHRFAATIDGWNDQVTSWITSILWVPHHVAGLIACLTGFLIIRYTSPTARIRAGAIAGLMFATAAGLSVYVVFVFAVFLMMWLAITLIKQDRRQPVAICVSGLVALAAAGTYLVELRSGLAGQRSGGGPFIQPTIRQFTPVDIIIETFWPREGWLVTVANLLLLPLNYYLELGFFFVVGVMQWKKMRRGKDFFDQKELCGFVLAATSVLICTFLRSGVISNNDLGWRGFLPAQFILLLWAVELWDDGLLWVPRRGLITALLILGVAGTVYEACMLRFYYAGVVDFDGRRTYALRQAYERLKNRLPQDAIVQHNPNAIPGDPFYGLYADRQAAAETSQCGVVFGGDPALCAGIVGPINDLFDKPRAVDAGRVDGVCKDLSIDALVVKDTDKVWADKNSWVWNKQPDLANDYARVFLCGKSKTGPR
jgi:hypothetical protein